MGARAVRGLVALGAVSCGLVFAVAAARGGSQTQFDSGGPTPAEQQVLEIINRARADPAAEGTRLHIDIDEGLPNGQSASVHPPLAMSKILLGTARAHSQDMYARKFFDHVNPDNLNPYDRMTAAGYAFTFAGENIAVWSKGTAAFLEDQLMVDAQEPGRGHRVNLLNTNAATPVFREIGIGYDAGAKPITGAADPNLDGLKDFLTQDFGTSATGPFVLGVVYADANGNGAYDVGEGLSGVTVSPDVGDFFAVTGQAGGFAFPVGTSGTLTVTASGGTLAGQLQSQVPLTGVNAKADFVGHHIPVATVTVASLTFNFKTAGKDKLKVTARVTDAQLPVSLAGVPVTIAFGEISRTATLDLHGKAKLGDATVTVKPGKGSAPATVTLLVKGSDFSAATPFAAEAMDGAATVKNVRTPVSGTIDLGSGPVTFGTAVTYTAKAAKSGTAKLAKP